MAEFTQEQLMTALRNAHAADDQEGAHRIAGMIQAQRPQAEPAPQQAPMTARLPPELAAPADPQVEAMKDGYSVITTNQGRFLANPQGQWLPLEVDGQQNEILTRALDRNTNDPARAASLARQAESMTVDRSDKQGLLTNLFYGENAARGTGFYGNVLKGVPLVGSWVDEGIGKIEGALGGDEEAMAQRARDSQEAFAIAYPKTAIGANLGGAALTLPYAVANAPRAIGAGSTLSKVGRGVLAGTALGGAEGSIYGAGEGEEGSRLDNAQTGGLWGAAFGGGIGGAIPALGGLGRTLYNAAAGRNARAAARELGMQQDVAGLVADRVRADAPYAAKNIAAAGDSATLGNLGPSTRGLLDAVANAPGQSAAIARQGVEEIVEGASGRFTATLDDVLGAPQGPRSTMREIMQESATPRREAYEAAFASPIDYASDAGRNIEAAMRRVDPTDLQAAVREANAQMRDLGVDNQQIRATISDAGEVVFDQLPDVRQINALKQGLDTIAENSKNPFGVMTPQGVRAASQARALRDALGEAVPAYREALQLGGDAIASRNAVELGRNMLRPQFTREQMNEALEGLGETELARVRQGLRSSIDDAMANVRRGLTRTDSDPQSVLAPLRQLTAPAAREKVASILGADEVQRLFGMLDEAEQAFSMRIVAGSQTAPRLQTEQALRELVPGGVSGELIDKGVTGTLSSMAGRVAQAGGQTQEQAMDEIRAYLARTLTETGDVAPRVQQLKAFGELGERMQQGRKIAERTAQQVGAATMPPVAMVGTRPDADNRDAILRRLTETGDVATMPPVAMVGTRPDANNRDAILRRLAEAGYETSQIVEIMQGGEAAIAQALTR